jgi:proteasome lid subunit RPN8/RPN11
VTTLVLEPNFLRQIEAEGASAYPNECCGIMFGRDVPDSQGGSRIVERLMPVKNDFEEGEQYHRFSISGKQLMDAEKNASLHGQMVLGFYHSHPDHPARPSEYDREHAWAFYSYVIVAITKGQPTDMTSWLLHEQTATFSRQNIVEAHGETNEPTERNLIEPLEGRDPM